MDNDRRQELLHHYTYKAPRFRFYERLAGTPWSVYLEIPRLELELQNQDTPPVILPHIQQAIDYLWTRRDCGDFGLAPLLRILYRYRRSRMLPPEIYEAIEKAALGYIYWFEEPGEENMCFCTENHQIIHHANELLAAQLFPQAVFTNNGQPASWHRTFATERIKLWLDWRFRLGFSEWNSNCYYDEDLLALANLIDYAEDAEIRRMATLVTHIALLHIALNSFRGTFGSTHGRTYSRFTLNPHVESTSPLGYLFWGIGSLEYTQSFSATLLATSSYHIPPVIQAIARDLPPELENRERHSLNVEDAPAHGIYPEKPEHIGFFWGAQVFDHRQVVATSLALCPPKHNMYPRIRQATDHYAECERCGAPYDPDPDYTAMTQVDIYTYRTPDYMLSCAQDYRKAKPGFQQHIWQATLAGQAVVYTTHPGAADVGKSRPDYWHGNGLMPRAAAYRNVLVCLYRFDPAQAALGYTHAFFPRHAFDEWVERDGWVFGRKGDGYVALRAQGPMRWAEPGEDVNALRQVGEAEGWQPQPYELIADGGESAWLCELGNPAGHGSFEQFVARIAAAQVTGDVAALRYESPSLGAVEFGWEGNLRVAWKAIQLHDYPRLDNPYAHVEFDANEYRVECGGERALWQREVSR